VALLKTDSSRSFPTAFPTATDCIALQCIERPKNPYEFPRSANCASREESVGKTQLISIKFVSNLDCRPVEKYGNLGIGLSERAARSRYRRQREFPETVRKVSPGPLATETRAGFEKGVVQWCQPELVNWLTS
jgi:hypothetical protein